MPRLMSGEEVCRMGGVVRERLGCISQCCDVARWGGADVKVGVVSLK